VSSMATFSGFTNPAFSNFASSPSAYYSLGGIMSETTDLGLEGLGSALIPLQGLVEYNFNETQWSNASSTSYGGTVFGGSTGFAVEGEGLYVPIYGKQGILIFIGGDAPTAQRPTWSEGDSLVPMNQISVYDIESRSFFVQNAGGDIPNPRTGFCAVGVGSADKSSWEMYVPSENPNFFHQN
jgi:hypothetical protein